MGIKQNAAFYRRAAATLADWGWDDYLDWWPGWATRTNSSTVMMPQGVTVHHTAGLATATSYLVNPRDRPQLRVLANVHIDALEQRIRFICAGGASHGGYTHEACFRRVVNGTAPLDRDLDPGPDSKTFSINKRTVGIEVDGAGGRDEWSDWTYRATVATAAACQRAAPWPVGDSPRVGAHKEHTRRKPGDPFAPMGRFRRDVLDCLKTGWAPPGVRPDYVLGDRVLSKDGNDRGPDVAALIDLLRALGHDLRPDDEFGPATRGAVIAFQQGHGLKPDGVVRLGTVEALRRALTKPGSNDLIDSEVTEPKPTPVAGSVTTQQPDAGVPLELISTPPRRRFRFGQANLQAERFGGLADDTARRGEYLRDQMKCSIYALCEVPEASRNAIRAVLGAKRWKVFCVGFACVLWDAHKWQHGGCRTVDFGTANVHGAVRVTLRDRQGSGLTLDVISMHVRPSAVTDLGGKLSDISAGMRLYRPGVPTLVAGDFNTGKAFSVVEPLGFRRSTRHVDTVNAIGEQRLDAVFGRGLKVSGQELLDPGALSDHKVWLVKATLSA